MTALHCVLGSIAFTDVYLGEKAAYLAGVPGKSDPIPAPDETAQDFMQLREQCLQIHSETSRNEFNVRYADISFRASVLESLMERVFVLRRMPLFVSSLESLNFNPIIIDKLMTPNMRGLVVIAGAYGNGKTTTASAVVAGRLIKFGGVAVTIEDPPEMPLEGLHGEGKCYQTWVEKGGFGEACRKAARWSPSIIMLGEIRDSESAIEALRASINGRLVICTTHADSVSLAVERLYALASASGGSSEDVASLLGGGLAGVIHQKLVTGGTEEGKLLRMQFLWFDDDESSRGLRTTIKTRKFEQIENEVALQKNKLFRTHGALA